MTIQQSKEWKIKSGNPLCPQGWTCPCGTNYRTKYGVIVEIVAPGVDGILYCRAPVPDEHVNEMRAIMHELKLKPTSPMALYRAVPVCKPSNTILIIKKERDMYVWEPLRQPVDLQVEKGLPTFPDTSCHRTSYQEAEKGAEPQTVGGRERGGFHVEDDEGGGQQRIVLELVSKCQGRLLMGQLVYSYV
jgi:hypothetical protein